MTTMRSKRIAALAALLATGPVLAAIGPIEMVLQPSAFDSSDWKQVEAVCPPGTIAFSGGASLAPASGFPDTRWVVHQSLPQGNPPTGWLVLAQERVPTAESWAVYSVALCAAIDGYERVQATSPFDSTSPRTVAVSCPPGKVPIGGGGGVFLFSPSLAMYSLLPTASGWEVQAAETNPVAGNWLLSADASCAPVAEIERFELISANGVEAYEEMSLHCPAGRRAVAGGVQVPAAQGILGTYPNGIGWHAGGLRIIGGAGAPWTLREVVLCTLLPLFADGFESGSLSAWSASSP